MTRRTLVGSLVATAAALQAKGARKEWKPKLGVLGPYTPANVTFARSQGYNNMIVNVGRGLNPETTDAEVEAAKKVLSEAGMNVSALQLSQNHISPDPVAHQREVAYFQKTIELAGKMGVRHIGAMSGKNERLPFARQVEEIVRVYEKEYFPLCEKYKVIICWEPWPEGPNLATSPVGYEALFRGFGNSPWVGLQFDPSHAVRQFMDPIEIAKQFVDKIHDVHLKDTEILTAQLLSGGIHPVNGQQWWRYRIPGLGSIPWNQFFSVLQEAGYEGAMSVEHEDDLYGAANNPGPDFSEDYKVGFIMAKRYLSQYVPV